MIGKLLKFLVLLLIIGVFGFLGYIVSGKRINIVEQVRPTITKQVFLGNIWKYFPDVVASGIYDSEGYLQIGEDKRFLSGEDVYFGSLYQLDNQGYFTLVNSKNLTDESRVYFDFYHSKDWIIGTLKTRNGDMVTYEHDPKSLSYSIGSKDKDFFVTDPSNSFGLRKDHPEDVKLGSILEISPKYYIFIAPHLRPIIGKATFAEKPILVCMSGWEKPVCL